REGRSERGKKLLGGRARRGAQFFVGHAVETRARAQAQIFAPDEPRRHTMKAPVKGRALRAIADQVVALLIFKDAANAARQIVVIDDGEAARLLRQITQARLRLEQTVAATIKLLGELI